MKGDLDVVLPALRGVTYRQLDYWVRVGYLHPDHDVPQWRATSEDYRGTGYARSWPTSEIRVARLMARLVAVGLPPAVAHQVARHGGDLGDGIRVVIEA